MKFELPIRAVINAQKCQADGDLRPYLNGIHITKKSVESTNGHIAYKADLCYGDAELDNPESLIIKIIGQIRMPRKSTRCKWCDISIDGERGVLTAIDQFGEPLSCNPVRVISEKFPDIEMAISKAADANSTGDPTIVDANYLSILKKLTDGGRHSMVSMETRGGKNPLIFGINDPLESLFKSKFIVMPCRSEG